MKLDDEGRLIISGFIRNFINITDRVAFVGRGDYCQLWEPPILSNMQRETGKEQAEGAEGTEGIVRSV